MKCKDRMRRQVHVMPEVCLSIIDFAQKRTKQSILFDNNIHPSNHRSSFCPDMVYGWRCEILQTLMPTSEDCCLKPICHRSRPSCSRLVLYVFDCCSESREVATGFRAIITIRKKQGRSVLRSWF